jgi:UDP-2,3-diacylglucosamine pyrophosphatase LpxH
MKTLILSDLHLGTGASRGPSFLDGLRTLARQYDRVILNGDTLDRYEKPNCEPHSENWIAQAREACRGRSAEAELLTGNHDPAISNQNYIYDAHSATLVFHGDCISDMTHPTKRSEQILGGWLARRWEKMGGRPARFIELTAAHRETQAAYLRENPPLRDRNNAFEYLAAVLYPPHKPLHVLRYWHRAPGRVAALAATFDRPVRTVVFGHTHRSGEWRIGGMRVINAGSFMPLSTPQAVCIDGADVHMRPVKSLLRSYKTIPVPAESAVKRPISSSEVQA